MNMLRCTSFLMAMFGLLAMVRLAGAVPIRLDLSQDSELNVSLTLVGAINATDADVSQISGYFDADIDFDSQGRPIASRIVTADLSATDVELSLPLGFPLGSLDVATHDLHLSAFTPDAPPNPAVDPSTGFFDLDLHRFRLDGGTASAESVFYSGVFDFAVEPEEFTPLDGMQGTLTQTAGPGGGPVLLTTPIALREYVTTIEIGPFASVDVYIDLNGTLSAAGLYEPATVPGDTDGNGVVDLEDLNNVRNHFGGTGLGDTNGDGLVDLEDLNAVRNNFGAGGGAVPEPSSLALFIAVGAAIWCLGRRTMSSGNTGIWEI